MDVCRQSYVCGTIGAISNTVQYVHCTVLQIGCYGCLPTIIRGTISAISNIVQYVHCTVLQIGRYGCLPTDLKSHIIVKRQKNKERDKFVALEIAQLKIRVVKYKLCDAVFKYHAICKNDILSSSRLPHL
jgi:hypothetical protein